MFCKPEVKLILESLWAVRENGRAEISRATAVIQRISAESKREVFANGITRHGHMLTAYRTCATISVHWTTGSFFWDYIPKREASVYIFIQCFYV